MLTCLVPVLFTFYIQDVLKLKKNNSDAKGLLILRIRNVSGKCCRENQNTHFVFYNTFIRESCLLWDNLENYFRAMQATDGNISRRMRSACWIPQATNTNSEYVILITSPLQKFYRKEPQCYAIYIYIYIYTVFTRVIHALF